MVAVRPSFHAKGLICNHNLSSTKGRRHNTTQQPSQPKRQGEAHHSYLLLLCGPVLGLLTVHDGKGREKKKGSGMHILGDRGPSSFDGSMGILSPHRDLLLCVSTLQ